MQTKEALKIIGGSLSKPSKMPGWSIGLPAKECKTGSKRHVILEKAVEYLKDPRFGLQGDKPAFLKEEVGLLESEYLTCLNRAAGGDYWQ